MLACTVSLFKVHPPNELSILTDLNGPYPKITQRWQTFGLNTSI